MTKYKKPESYSNASWEMVQGYMEGGRSLSLELPECHLNKSAAFKHGWLNGRDDRVGKPRESMRVLKARAAMIESAHD